MPVTQTDRPVAITSPLGADVLLFKRMTGTEELGRLFTYELELLSEDQNIKLADVLGQPLTVELEYDGGTRYFNGFASSFSYAGVEGEFARYRATLRPWLWFLTRTSDCRIFQQKKVPDIVTEIFKEHGFSDVEQRLSGAYREWNYCVQYRESDFNFVSRLLEQEGIYYYFKHEDGKHTLVMADSVSAHDTIPDYAQIPYYPPTQELVREEHVSEWQVCQQVQSGTYALNDFDFEKPKAGLTVKSSVTRENQHSKYEVYDYPGEYTETGDGDAYAKARIEELQAQFETVSGDANARGLHTGGLFELIDFPRADQNREYLVISARYDLESGQYKGQSAGEGQTFVCSFRAIDSKQPFRAQRTTPKPTIPGPQSAIVVGPSGDEIWTDEYGRVKVQFHWDREGKSDENSSCWIRVSQAWAGKQWGSIHVPRIGQEVLVDFHEGDPDAPIITGRVYNADAMPPYDLPANATQSGIKSRSSKKGNSDNFNEIRFEDKKDEEQLYIHAEKNQDIVVENDETHSVGNDRTKDVGNDETTTIGNNRTETVEKDETISIGENRTEDVGKNETITIGENRIEEVGKDETINIGANREETVAKKESVSIGDDREHSVGKDDNLSVGKKWLVDAGDQIVLKTGKASITMKKDGSITIKGKDITLDGSGKINIKASKDVTIKGSKINQN